MAITVKHKFVSAIPDAGDTTIVQPSNWNDDHQLTGTVPVANGGTGASTLTGYVKGTGTTAMTAATTIPNTDITGLGTASTKDAGVANGVATLDSGGTVPLSQLPPLGDLNYQGAWNANTNTPTLTSSVGTKGYYYVVSVSGTTNLNGITDWQVGDWAVFNGSVWQKIDNTDSVTSVNGYTGAVVLTYTDVGAFPATSTSGTGNVVLATGATQAHPTISDYEIFTSTTPPSYAEGRVWFDSANHTLAQFNDVTNNTVHLGEEIQLKVINNTGSTINIGQPVYITGTTSGQTYPNVALAIANTLATSNVIGLANQAIPSGTAGYVTTIGLIQGINTGSYTVGDTLYLSPYSAGFYQNTIPPTGYAIKLGTVAYVNSLAGAIYINKSNLSVQAGNIVGQVAVANGGTGASTLTGYVKGSGTSVMTASSTIPTTDLSGTITNAQLANSAITINGTSTSLGGSISVGTVTSVSGTSPVVSSGGNTPAISIPAATGSVNGYLTSTDWTTFNNKQPAGSYLTAVTADAPLSGSGTSGSHLVIATANTTTTGAISSTDWNTFNGKQAALVSGTNIKTVNGTTLLGSGDLGTITYAYGGTGQTTVTTGDLLYGSATNVWSKLGIGSTGQILRVVSGAPAWGTDYTGTVTSVSGTGTVSGISLSGTVTSSGSLTLGGTLDLSSPPAIGGTAANTITGTTITATKFVGVSGGTF
jgi:hypothetical protein